MNDSSWIVIPRWEDFQHRDAGRSSVLPWIKVYTELMAKEEFLNLSFHLRGVLVSIWLEYATSKRQLSDNSVRLSRRLGQKVTRRELDSLSRAGFLAFSASKPASNYASRPASLEKEKEKEKISLRDKRRADEPEPGTEWARQRDKELNEEKRQRGEGWVDDLNAYTGCRIVRGEVGVHHIYDPLGTERPPADWPHQRPTRAEIRKALDEQKELAHV